MISQCLDRNRGLFGRLAFALLSVALSLCLLLASAADTEAARSSIVSNPQQEVAELARRRAAVDRAYLQRQQAPPENVYVNELECLVLDKRMTLYPWVRYRELSTELDIYDVSGKNWLLVQRLDLGCDRVAALAMAESGRVNASPTIAWVASNEDQPDRVVIWPDSNADGAWTAADNVVEIEIPAGVTVRTTHADGLSFVSTGALMIRDAETWDAWVARDTDNDQMADSFGERPFLRGAQLKQTIPHLQPVLTSGWNRRGKGYTLNFRDVYERSHVRAHDHDGDGDADQLELTSLKHVEGGRSGPARAGSESLWALCYESEEARVLIPGPEVHGNAWLGVAVENGEYGKGGAAPFEVIGSGEPLDCRILADGRVLVRVATERPLKRGETPMVETSRQTFRSMHYNGSVLSAGTPSLTVCDHSALELDATKVLAYGENLGPSACVYLMTKRGACRLRVARSNDDLTIAMLELNDYARSLLQPGAALLAVSVSPSEVWVDADGRVEQDSVFQASNWSSFVRISVK